LTYTVPLLAILITEMSQFLIQYWT